MSFLFANTHQRTLAASLRHRFAQWWRHSVMVLLTLMSVGLAQTAAAQVVFGGITPTAGGTADANGKFLGGITFSVKSSAPSNPIDGDAVIVVDLYEGATRLNRFTYSPTVKNETILNTVRSGTIYGTLVGVGTHNLSLLVSTVYGGASKSATVQVVVTGPAKASQTITFPTITPRTQNSGAFALSASASSGLGVSYTNQTPGVCSVSGSTVSLTTPGSCSIAADQAGSTSYNPAPQVVQAFTVLKNDQSITFGTLAPRNLGTGTFTVSASASSGLSVSFGASPSNVCTLSGVIVTLVGQGTCTITATQAGDSLYNAAPAALQTFPVGAAALLGQSITFGTLSGKTYGDPPFTVSASASSTLAVSFSASPVSVCSISGTTVTINGGGTCAISANQSGNGTYSAASTVTQNFPVAKANQSINFGSLVGKTIGDPAFTVNATATSTLTLTYTSGTPTICSVTGNSVSLLAAGACTINADQAGNTNYNAATRVSQSFNVAAAKQNQTITFNIPPDRVLGAAPITLFATASSGLSVTFASTSPSICSVSGNKATLLAFGLCTIATNQAGDATYNAAPQQTQSFNILNAPPVIFTSVVASPASGTADANGNFVAGIAYTVKAANSIDTITDVDLYDGGTKIATIHHGFTLIPSGEYPVNQVRTWTLTGTVIGAGVHNLSIIAHTYDGLSASSNAVTVTVTANVPHTTQTITFAKPADRTLNAGSFNVSASTTSNLVLTYVSNSATICSINSVGLVTLLSTGTCSLTVSQTGNSTYIAAVPVTQTFVIYANGLAPTVTLNTPSAAFNGNVGSSQNLAATITTLVGAPAVATVKFYANGTEVATGINSGGTWSASWIPTQVGLVDIVAKAFDGTGTQLAISATVSGTVGGAIGVGGTSSTPIPVSGITLPHLNNADAGSLPGNLSVSPSGAATYSMDITVPPGVAGLQPSLSLDYSSQGNNGIVGLGWTLGGLSSIHRCGKTIAQDGINDRINFSNTDRLCLNGQRLVLANLALTDTNYWANNAEYRTEVDSFSRITTIIDGAGKRTFKVESKDGKISTYGNGSAYVIPVAPAPGSVNSGTSAPAIVPKTAAQGAQSWALDKITDLNGNYIQYNYTQDLVSGEHLPSLITYGGSGLVSHAAVAFTFEGRQDAWKRYIDETKNDLRSRLTNIKTYTGNNLDAGVAGASLVSNYQLAYEYSPTSGRSLLASVQVSAVNPVTGQLETLPKTTFAWGKPDPAKAPGFESQGIWNGAPILTTHGATQAANHSDFFAFSDFNNDGFTDVLEKRVTGLGLPAGATAAVSLQIQENPLTGTFQTQYRYFQNNKNGFTSFNYKLNTNEAFAVLQVGDFDGDGILDLLVVTAAGQNKICTSPIKSGLAPTTNPITFTCSAATIADVNNTSWKQPLVIDALGEGRSAFYSPLDLNQNATLCLQGTNCITDYDPPRKALSPATLANGTPETPQREFVGFTQMVDFTGIGKPYDVRFSIPHFVKEFYDSTDGGVQTVNAWFELQPEISMTGFTSPTAQGGTRPTNGDIARFTYPPYANPGSPIAPGATGVVAPYIFDKPASGAGLSADFNGAGYSGMVFGFLEIKFDAANTKLIYPRQDTTLCISTGRALDCNVSAEASGANYRTIQSVGNFIGDGQSSVLRLGSRDLAYNYTTPEICTFVGFDTTNGATSTDSKIVCKDWTVTGSSISNSLLFRDNPSAPAQQAYFMDLLGTGRTQVVVYHSGSFVNGTWQEDGRWEVFAPIDRAVAGQALDRIYQVTNGIGATASVEYADGLTSGIVGQSSNPVTLSYPLRRNNNPGKLVSRLKMSAGYSSSGTAERVISYSYKDGAIDASGRGSLGFGQVTMLDEQNQIETVTKYSQTRLAYGSTIASNSQSFPFTSMPINIVVTDLNTFTQISFTTNDLDKKEILQTSGQKTYFPYVARSTVVRNDPGSYYLGRTVTTSTYDGSNGSLSSQTVTATGQGGTYTSVNNVTAFQNTTAPWCLGLPLATNTQNTDPVYGVVRRDKTYTYDSACRVQSETQEPSTTATKVVTTNTRNGFGLVTNQKQDWINPETGAAATRSTGTTYDAKGVFVATQTNAVGNTETRSFYPGTGAPKELIGPNGLSTKWEVDAFGRVTKESRADGNETRQYRKQCDSACPAGAVMVTIMDSYNGASRISVPSLQYVDSVGHPLRSQSYGFDGRPIITDQRYDTQGRLYETDQARYLTDSAYLAERQNYDQLDRVIQTDRLDEQGSVVSDTTEYRGPQTFLTNAIGQQRTDTKDVLGRVVQVQDSGGYLTSFGYDGFGNLKKTIDPNGNVILVDYDNLGRKIRLTDPNLGIINYSVDPLGRTWRQISANQATLGQSSISRYDVLDRLTDRIEPDLESHWIFNNTAVPGSAAIGQLAEAYTGPAAAKTYRRLHTYDSLGRPLLTSQSLSDAVYTSQPTYDAWGRVITQTVQRGTDTAKKFYTRYNDKGYLARIERDSLILWQANQQDASNRVLQGQYGNGLKQVRSYNVYTGRLTSGNVQNSTGVSRLQESYQYNAIGNVLLRGQYWDINGFSETFQYDNLNRITNSTVTSAAGVQATQLFTYDAAGNILSKTGVGSGNYVYPVQGATAVRPHAVTSIPGLGSFGYDANGNQTSGAGKLISWTSFDMPNNITKGTQNTQGSNFVYGPEHQRTRQDKLVNNAITGNIVYAGSQEIELDNASNIRTIKTYWPAGVGVEIEKINTITNAITTPTTYNWTHLDRLGSPIAISDNTGALKEKLAYDAWGKRRTLDGAPINGTPTPDTIDGQTDNKGFTGHEMLDQLDLVHMNGRVYDPLTAKFLSGDPLIQDPTNGQNYNRYAYVLNNPTNLTDPTGFADDCVSGSSASTCKTDQKTLTPDPGLDQKTEGTAYKKDSGKNDSAPAPAGAAGITFASSGGAKTNAKQGGAAPANPSQLVPNPANPDCKSGPCIPAGQTEEKNGLAKQAILGTFKIVGGGLSAFGGGTICVSLIGCSLGGPAVLIGLSEVRQGGTMLADALNGTRSEGDNPTRRFAVENFGTKGGNALYDGTALFASGALLTKTVPLAVGVSDGINRPLSLFGVTTSVYNNAKYIPLTNTFISMPIMQTSYELTNLYKASVVVRDLKDETK